MRVLPYGDAALLIEPDEPAAVLALAARLERQPEVEEVVPATRTLLVRGAPAGLARLTARLPELAALGPEGDAPPSGTDVVLDVRYDGADLEPTAAELGVSVDELIARHAAGNYVVAFCGFAPGFAYLTGLDPALHVPRWPEPRTRVPAGSVAIAGEFTGVYPRPSPGGWRLLGTTDAALWDLSRTPPALLPPGTRVRFRPA
jgi:KipI family sensor histidine kinase inhibitor